MTTTLPKPSTSTTSSPTPKPSLTLYITYFTPPTLIASSLSPPPQAWKRLSPEEMASQREQGLCFNCEEKFHRGHRCASRFFLFISEEDDPPPLHIPASDPPNVITHDPPQLTPPDPPDSPNSYPAQISLNSLVRRVEPETIRLMGNISGHPLLLLVDGG